MDGISGILFQLRNEEPREQQKSASVAENLDNSDALTTEEVEELSANKRGRDDVKEHEDHKRKRQKLPHVARRRPVLAVQTKASLIEEKVASKAEKERSEEPKASEENENDASKGTAGDENETKKGETAPSKPEVYEPCAVFINSLPFALKDTQPLKDVFLQFGNIREAHIAFDGQGKSKGVGCILFDNEQSANAAISLLPHPSLMGRQLEVRPCKKRFIKAFHRPKIERLPQLGTALSFKPRTLRKS